MDAVKDETLVIAIRMRTYRPLLVMVGRVMVVVGWVVAKEGGWGAYEIIRCCFIRTCADNNIFDGSNHVRRVQLATSVQCWVWAGYYASQ